MMRVRAEEITIIAMIMISNNDCNINISYQEKKLIIFFQISRSNLSVTPRACHKREKKKKRKKRKKRKSQGT